MIPAPRNNPDFNSHEWQDWFFQVWKELQNDGGSGMVPKELHNLNAQANWAGNGAPSGTTPPYNSLNVNSGLMIWFTEKKILEFTGKGEVLHLALRTLGTTTKQLTIRINIDGVDVYNYQSAVIGASATYPAWATFIGGCWWNGVPESYQPTPFQSNFTVYATTTVTEIDGFSLYYNYNKG
jgi:hypothetical protein